MQILRKEIHRLGYTANFSLYDEKDVRRLGQNLARHLLQHEGELPSMEKTFGKISYAKSRGLSFEEAGKDKADWNDSFSLRSLRPAQDLHARLQCCRLRQSALA